MLLDTSGFLAYLFQGEKQHTQAVTLFESNRRKITHSFVLAELIALAHARQYPRHIVLGFLDDLLSHPQVEITWVDEALHRQAVTLLLARSDKGYSLCDAVSFVLMRQHAIREALTTDRHFEQEGFVRLLEP